MSLKDDYYKLSKESFNKQLENIKNSKDTLYLLDNKYFYYVSNEITNLIITLNKKQIDLDNLINSFSCFTKKQIIQSFMLDEIEATNRIESIFSTRHDIFSFISKAQNCNDKKIVCIANMYYYLFTNGASTINSLKDIRFLYDQLILPTIETSDKPDGLYFRKEPVFISDGLNNIHKGLNNQESSNKEMEHFLKLYNSDLEIYQKILITHFLFEEIHPFYDGNGRFGRFLLSNKLYQETNSFVSFIISKAFLENKNKYYNAFKKTHDIHEFGCVNVFVKELIEIIIDQIDTTYNKLLENKEAINETQIDNSFSKKEKQIYQLINEASLFSDYGISNKELLEETHCSKRTLLYTLKLLREKELIIDTKFGRFTYHKLIK